MAEIGFYHLQRSTLEAALPSLIEKILEAGHRAVIMAGSPDRVTALDSLLWTYRDESFLPHGAEGAAGDGGGHQHPVWLTTSDENPNRATVLVLTDGADSAHLADYERCCVMFDGNDPDAVATARAGWKETTDAGHAVTYWQQTDRGGWEKKG